MDDERQNYRKFPAITLFEIAPVATCYHYYFQYLRKPGLSDYLFRVMSITVGSIMVALGVTIVSFGIVEGSSIVDDDLYRWEHRKLQQRNTTNRIQCSDYNDDCNSCLNALQQDVYTCCGSTCTTQFPDDCPDQIQGFREYQCCTVACDSLWPADCPDVTDPAGTKPALRDCVFYYEWHEVGNGKVPRCEPLYGRTENEFGDFTVPYTEAYHPSFSYEAWSSSLSGVTSVEDICAVADPPQCSDFSENCELCLLTGDPQIAKQSPFECCDSTCQYFWPDDCPDLLEPARGYQCCTETCQSLWLDECHDLESPASIKSVSEGCLWINGKCQFRVITNLGIVTPHFLLHHMNGKFALSTTIVPIMVMTILLMTMTSTPL